MIIKIFEIEKFKKTKSNIHLIYGVNEGTKEDLINNLYIKNFDGDILPPTSASRKFTDNTLLGASLSGSQDTGSIVFTSLDTEYDRLLRYKFFGNKVCNVLGFSGF